MTVLAIPKPFINKKKPLLRETQILLVVPLFHSKLSITLTFSQFLYTGFRIYGPRFCPDKVDHIAEMTIYPKNLVLKSD